MSAANLLEPADWTFPVPIKYGPGRLRELGVICAQAGMKNPLLVTDRGSRDLAFIDGAMRALAGAGIPGTLFFDVAPNPTVQNVLTGRDLFRSGEHDGVIGIGGGSGMDAAKAISLVSHREHDIWHFDYSLERTQLQAPGTFPKLVCIPTTAGTGAETDSTAMITDTAAGVKRCIWHPAQKPCAVILDPELTLGLPPTLTAWTGVDAVVHAIEALSVPGWHPLCDGLAQEAIRLIYPALPRAFEDGDDLASRAAMQVGACLAGIAFLKGLGLVHAISHVVGAVCDTHHGLTNAVLLPPVLNFNRHGLGDKTALMCKAMQLPAHDFDALYMAIVSLLDQLDIPRDLAALGVGEAQAAEIAAKASGDAACATNPVAATKAQIEPLLRKAILKAR